MFHLDNPSGVPAMPPLQAVHSATKLWFTEGGNGQAPSWPGADWFNIVTEELLGVLALAGISPVKGELNQLAKAVQEIAFSVYPVGAPIPYSLATPPSGFLMMQGQSFSKATYPKLGLVYPSGVLPDMRAEFIRGWDNGRGVDVGRVVGSKQADEIKEHKHFISSRYAGGTGTSASGFVQLGYASTEEAPMAWALTNGVENLDGSAAGGNETRPRNIAFNYIVRAA